MTDAGSPAISDCVVTTLVGGYETLNEQPVAETSRLRFICLTDDPGLRSDTWEMRTIDPVFPLDPVRSQRHLKIMVHDFLPEFDRSLYIDNSVILKVDPGEILERCLGESGFAVCAHSFRDTVLDEFLEVAKLGLDDPSRIFEQLHHYSIACPEILHERPTWSGIIMRDHRSEEVRRLSAIWRDHVMRYSRRDQLSFLAACRQAGYEATRLHEDNHESWFHRWPEREKRLPNVGLRAPEIASLPSKAMLAGLQKQIETNAMAVIRLREEIRQRDTRIRALEESANSRSTGPLRGAADAIREPLHSIGRKLRKRRKRQPQPEAEPQSKTANGEVFARDGYLGPVSLFTKAQAALILRHFRECGHIASPEWPKDLAVKDRFFHEVAMRPQIVERLKPLLGEDIVLWGASVVEREPGQVHPSHTDIESSSAEGGFVSVWIGLENTSQANALKLFRRSHLIGRPVQQEAHMRGVPRGEATDDMIAEWCREAGVSATLVQPEMADGDGIFFDGRLWHGSDNRGEARRSAVLLQYARADVPVRIQEFGNVDWPFKFTETSPRRLRVAGYSSDCETQPSLEPLDTVIRPGEGYVEDEKGWIPYHIMQGPTPNAFDMESHVSVLSPGHSPHPPHCHVEEELLIVLRGEAEILITDGVDPDGARIERMRPGSFVYYPAYQYHTIRNVSSSPVTYLMYKWQSAPKETESPLATFVQHADDDAGAGDHEGQAMRFLFEDETGFLAKLHSHETVMGTGAGYPAHEDAHDVAIIVLEGQVEANGEKLGPGGTAFHPAGTSHGLRNPGADPARYLVFEFHGGP